MRRPSSSFLSKAVLDLALIPFLGVLAVGCSAASDDDAASSEAANTEGARPLTVVAAREWGRCWFDVAGNDGRLSCTSTARGNDPLGATVEVTAAGMGDPMHFVSLQKTLDIEAGGTVVLGTIPRASFPVILMLHATLSRDSSQAIGNAHNTDLYLKPTVRTPEDLPAGRAAIIKQPFNLWPAAFIDSEPSPSFSVSASYGVPLAPYEGFLSETTMELTPSFSGYDVKGKVRYFAAPALGDVALSLSTRNGAPQSATLSQPGYYTIGANGMRPATPEEIARDFPAGTTTTPTGGTTDPTGGTTPTPTPPPPPPPPPAPVDSDPTCGGNGQAKCANGSCDSGTRYDSNNFKCVTCGADGQTYCFDGANNATGNKTCNAGTRYDQGDYKCVACGGAGQTYCFSDPGNTTGVRRCNDGTRYDQNNYTCVACGGNGQTYCFADVTNATGARKCNAGTRYDQNNYNCITCGGVGQTYCFDDPNNASGTRICNPGLRYDATNYVCVQ